MSLLMEDLSPCWLSLPQRSAALPFERQDDDILLRFRAPAGLFQFSVIADASEFNWDELYIDLYAYHNTGQRTGPWDFDPTKQNYPLVPSYWVYLDGRRIGLWYFQRVSLDDIAARRFRGRMACWITVEGEHELKFVPYRDFKVNWLSSRLETDPEDQLNAVSPPLHPTPLSQWADEAYWTKKQAELQTTHSLFREPLNQVFRNVIASDDPAPNEWLALIVAHRLDQNHDALHTLLAAVDECLDRPHWGNPREDGYGHDGDMAAAFLLRGLTWVYYGVGDELGLERRSRLLAKVSLQGNRFLELALLNRDYWGGSLLQDHGWRSLHTFAFVALSWQGILPAATDWLRYALPRSRRALEAMPRDGVVPQSSHNSLILYLDDISDLRPAWLAYSGEDLYETYPFQPILDFLCAGTGTQAPALALGGNGFLNQMANHYRDGRVAWLQAQLLFNDTSEWSSLSRRHGYHAGIVRGFLCYEPTIAPEPPVSTTNLHFFADSGLVHYSDPESALILSVRCGPWGGHHADRHATGSCDRMGMAPGAGHFVLRRSGQDLLASPDPGYALQSINQSCLLINNRGQRGDVGYPMSIPSWQHSGEEIESVHWDAASRTGCIRLQLTPAYPPEAAVAHYTRDFLIAARRITIRDHIVLSQPGHLSWLFQTKSDFGLALDLKNKLCARFGGVHGLTLSAHPQNLEISSSIHPTPVVWSYASSNHFKPFEHVRFDAMTSTCNTQIEFEIRW